MMERTQKYSKSALYNNKSWSLRKLNQFDEALKNYEKQLELMAKKSPLSKKYYLYIKRNGRF